ncbi:MAG: hypothetical protein Q9191_000955 [Dirinaria sp. TL-2023a]
MRILCKNKFTPILAGFRQFIRPTCGDSNVVLQPWKLPETSVRPYYAGKNGGNQTLFKGTTVLSFGRYSGKQGHRLSSSRSLPDSELSRSSVVPISGSGPPVYERPRTGLLSLLPESWVPFAELARLDKPTGTYYLLFPCLFSTLLAADYTGATPWTVMTTSMLFAAGALVMRGAGCTINDLWDRDLDPHVSRTRHRPIARGAVTPLAALTFTGLQLFAGLGILTQFPPSCLYFGIPSLLLVGTYPLAKRVTNYPQVVLGFTFSWGAFMGFPALGIDPFADHAVVKAVGALYASCIAWTVLYDMIYAHMDLKDDAKIGIKSIALRHEKQTKLVLSGLAATQIVLLSLAGSAINAGPLFFGGSCGCAATTLGLMIWKVELREASSCWWWFKNGALFTGGAIALGLIGNYYSSMTNQEEKLTA